MTDSAGGRRPDSGELPDFTEKRVAGQVVHDVGFLRVEQHTVEMPSGDKAPRVVVRHCGAVAILPVFANGDLLLVHQFRYPLNQHLLEIPAGKLDDGEPPLDCARRELLEETGHVSDRLEKVYDTHPAVGYSDEMIRIYVAWNVSQAGEASPDSDENVHAVRLGLADARARLEAGQITENRTQLAILWLCARQQTQ